MQKNTQEYIISSEKEINEIEFDINIWDRVFFYGELGSGKSTVIRNILRKYSKNPDLIVRSPTYIYYQRYRIGDLDIFHCDLYRLNDYGTWISLWWEEIAQDKQNVLLIEWPEILGDSISPTKKIYIEIIENEKRKMTITQI